MLESRRDFFKHLKPQAEESLPPVSAPIESPFTGGLFYWYLIRERGLSHSILAHATHNSACLTGILLKNFPKKASV